MTENCYREDVESQCSVTRRQVQLTLQTKVKPRGSTITGAPVECNHYKATCYSSVRCMLKGIQITTGRRKNK